MARELPIRNGRLTTDLDAAGHKIKNLPPGEGFTQAQADWNQTDATAPDFIKNKPTIPAPVTVDSVLSTTSENPVQNRVVAAAMDARPTKAEIDAGWWSKWAVVVGNPEISVEWLDTGDVSVPNGWVLWDNEAGNYLSYPPKGDESSTILSWTFGADSDYSATATRHRVAAPVPTKTSDLTNDGSDGEHPFLTSHQDISGKADKSEMSVTAGTGADADKATIQLKTGTIATVLTSHQAWGDVKPSGGIPKTDLASAVQTSLGFADTAIQPPGIAGLMQMYGFETVTAESGTLTVQPYRVFTYVADSNAAAFELAVGALPTGVTGKARDCILVIDCTATGAVAPTVTWDAHFHPRTDTATDLAIVEAGKRAVFYISEYAAGEFAVGGWVETEGGNA